MLPLKGIWQDSPYSKQPEGYAYQVLNGVIQKNIGAYTNENGAELFSSQYNALNIKPLGVFNAKYGKRVIFSVDGIDSHIGIINADSTYTSKVIEDLGFDEDHPIDAEIQYNFLGQLVVAFTDGVQTPKIINLDNITVPFNINDIQLFPRFKQPKIDSDVLETGGSVLSGTYIPVFKFKKNDLTVTGWSASGNPVYITEDNISEGYNAYDGVKAGTITSKSIEFLLTNVDTDYDKIILGIVSKIDGILVATEVKEVAIASSSITILYTGNEGGQIIDLKEITTPTTIYDSIKHLTQVQGNLYGAWTTEANPINFQPYANLITLKYTTELTTIRNLDESFKIHPQNGKKKGFAHGEVMAFYVRLKLINSGWSRFFLISGRAPTGTEADLNSTLVGGDPTLQFDLSISSTSRYFQMRDTSSPDGTFGFWQNENELYPNTDSYDSSGIGGEDLRGKKVRHHRFPSIRKMKESTYSGEANYGRTKLDILGVIIDSFPTLPGELSSQIEGYELAYAKRSPSNSTVNANSLALLGAKRNVENHDNNIYWTGGNWNNRESGDGNRRGRFDVTDALYADSTKLRFHSFDLLLNKPALSPSYIANEVKLTKTGINGHNLTSGPQLWSFEIDYIGANSSMSAVPSADRYKKLNNFKYVPAGTISGDVNNFIGEETATATIEGVGLTLGVGDNGMDINDNAESTLASEQTYLSTIMSYKTDIYSSFFNQPLVSTGKFFLLADTFDNIYGGDVFLGEFGFVTFAPRIKSDLESADQDDAEHAVKTVRSYICECINNSGLRYEDDINTLTKYYPKQAITGDTTWFVTIGRGRNPNILAYNKDYTSVNDLMALLPYNPYDIFLSEDPYRVIRSKPSSLENRQTSWRTFLANDYIIVRRDKGFITNIEGAGDDLFINLEFALLKTRGNEELATDSFKVVLGTGNIFERVPQEVIIENIGYAGCQHKYSCIMTRFGYFFIDENKRRVFLISDSPQDITIGLEKKFIELLSTTGDNPFNGKGYTVGWDEEYERIILSSVEADFTISYFPSLKTWTSEHSYRRDFLLGDRDSLLGFKDNKSYKHNIPELFGIYDEVATIYPFQIVAIFNMDEGIDKTLVCLNWFTEYILDNAQQRDVTFDLVSIWNSYQASGETSLFPYKDDQTYEWNYDNTNIRRKKIEWMFNKFRDIVKERNIRFIDDELNVISGAVDANQAFEYKKHLSDKFFVVKYLFSNKKINNLQGQLRVLDLGIKYNIANR